MMWLHLLFWLASAALDVLVFDWIVHWDEV